MVAKLRRILILVFLLAANLTLPAQAAQATYSIYDLGILEGPPWYGAVDSAYGVDNLNQVVGYSTFGSVEHAFLWEDGQMIDLNTLGGNNSHAYDINELGQVVS